MISRYPLIPVVMGYATGILATSYGYVPTIWAICISCLLTIVLLTLHFFRKVRLLHTIMPWVVFFLFMLIGNFRMLSSAHDFKPNHFSKFTEDTSYVWLGATTDAVKWGQKRAKVPVALSEVVIHDSVTRKISGQILLYFPVGDSALPAPGTRIAFKGQFTIPNAATFPGGFDYKNHLENQDIHHLIYLKNGDWLAYQSIPNWKYKAEKLRSDLLAALDSYPMDIASKAVAAALLLGYKDWMPSATREAFGIAGATHILAVSGLHVGIVYMIMMTLLGMRYSVKGKKWKMPIIIACIWGYAILTGLSPSVCRSATMFTFFAFSRLIGRRGNTHHLLLISAMGLLLYNPRLLFQLSFQLSYAAVFAIVSIVPLIQGLWTSKYALLRALRDLLAVSIAAQLGTLPITLYHFQQFPSYFLLGNLLLLPIIPLVMYFGLGSLLLSYFQFKLEWVELAFSYMLMYMNRVVAFIATLPHAQLLIAKPAVSHMLILSAFIVVIFWYWKSKKQWLLVTVGLVAPLLLGFQWFALEKAHQTENLYLVNGNNGIAILAIQKKQATLFNYSDTLNYGYQIAPLLHYHGISDTTHRASLVWRPPLLNFRKKGLLFLRHPNDTLSIDWSSIAGIVWQYQGVFAISEYHGPIFLDKGLNNLVTQKLKNVYPEQLWDFKAAPIWREE